jgi:hypothetical protein
VGAFDPQGRWVLFCQAEGDSMGAGGTEKPLDSQSSFLGGEFRPYFARRSSEIAPVTALLAASPNGRYVVLFSPSSGPELLDMETEQVESLGSLDLDTRADVMPGDLRSVAFSSDSSRLALLIHEQRPRVVVRDLRSGTNTEVIPAGDMVWRIGFDTSGQYVVLSEVLEDSNHSGRTQWPLPVRTLRETRCLGPIPAHAAYPSTGDRAQISIAPVQGGKSRLVPGFVTGLGSSLIVKSPSGGLSAIDGSRVRTISSPDCNAQIIGVAPDHGRILTGCRDANGRAMVELDSLGAYQGLEVDIPSSSEDWIFAESGPYRVLYSGVHSHLIDLARAKAIVLEDRDQMLAQGQAGILVRRGTAVVLFNPISGTSEPMLTDVRPGTRVILGKAAALVGQSVVSAEYGRVLGTLPKPALALASNGCALVPLGGASDARQFARGPLTWLCPSP